MPKEFSNRPDESKKNEQMTEEKPNGKKGVSEAQNTSERPTDVEADSRPAASGKEEGERPASKKSKRALKGKVSKRTKKAVKQKKRRFVHRVPGNYAKRGRRKEDPGARANTEKPMEETLTKEVPLGAFSKKPEKESTKGAASTAKRVLQEGESLVREEAPSEDAGEAPEQYAIDQGEGKAKKVGEITACETKEAVKKVLGGKEKDKAQPERTAPKEQKREDPTKPQVANVEQEAPAVYHEGLQTETKEGVSPNIIKEHGVKNRREETQEAQPAQPRAVSPAAGFPPPPRNGSGSAVQTLKENLSDAQPKAIAAARPDVHTLDHAGVNNEPWNPGVAPVSEEAWDSGISRRSNDLHTSEAVEPGQAAAWRNVYPEPGNSAYQYYPAVQAYREEPAERVTMPLGEESSWQAGHFPEDYQQSGQETYSDHYDKAPTSQTATVPGKQQRVEPQTSPKGTSVGSHYPPSSGSSQTVFLKFSTQSNQTGSRITSRQGGSTAQGSAKAGQNSGAKGATARKLKTREVNSSDIHVSGKVTLNTWQRDLMVNQIQNQTPALALGTAQGGSAIQAVAHYGQTTMLQAGGRMATAATGAVTGGVGIAVQAGKQIGQKIVEQIQAAIQNAAASARTTAKTWGTGTALLMLPVFFILCVAVLISSSRGSATNVNLSADVTALMPQINEACQRHGISEYAPLVAAVMMQESGGNVELVHGDVMQCAEGMGYPVGTPVSVEESIDFGTELLAGLLQQAGSTGPTDLTHISLALQSYNYGGGYLTWALNKYGGYSKENALEYSQQQAADMGWSGYGDPEYVDHVLRYYQISSGGLGDRSAIANGLFAYPFPGHTWTSYSGHEGIDIHYTGILGQPIYAAASGVVSYAVNGYGNMEGSSGLLSYGNCVFIDHGNGWESRYAHMTEAVVQQGTYIQEGQLIGYVGNSGNSFGAHLHLSLYYNGSSGDANGNYAEQAWPQLRG